jgi:toxin ParE1/3/4
LKPLHLRPEADADLDGLIEYYTVVAGAQLTHRFLDCVESTLHQISEFPDSGALVRPDTGLFSGYRFVVLHGFRQILVFYRNGELHIDVVRVIHGFRDLEEALR